MECAIHKSRRGCYNSGCESINLKERGTYDRSRAQAAPDLSLIHISFFRLIPYIRLPWLLIALGFVVNLGYSQVLSYVPVSTSALFSGAFTGSALASAVIYNVLNYALMFGSLILQSWVAYVAVRRAQEVLWHRMLRLDMAYYDTNNPSDLMSTLTNDTETAVTSLITQLISIIPSVYYLVRVCLTLNSYDFRLLLSILILIPINLSLIHISLPGCGKTGMRPPLPPCWKRSFWRRMAWQSSMYSPPRPWASARPKRNRPGWPPPPHPGATISGPSYWQNSRRWSAGSRPRTPRRPWPPSPI